MRIAVVGGGASGVATAWLLEQRHEVTLFERARMLGGHVRTLQANVRCGALPDDVRLDAGVVEFDLTKFQCLRALLGSLGVRAVDLPAAGCTTLSLADGRHYHSPGALRDEVSGLSRVKKLLEQAPLRGQLRRFVAQLDRIDANLDARPLDAYLGDDTFSTWVRALVMYAYSTPFADVGRISAGLALPMLRDFFAPTHWSCLEGGSFAWIERAAASWSVDTRLGAHVCAVRRAHDAVEITTDRTRAESFDAVVLAVPPHRTLSILVDPSEDEQAWFGDFDGGFVETVVHSDTSVYARHGLHRRSEFDFFALPSGDVGYNAYLNRLAQLPVDGPSHYSLAFHLDDELPPDAILHRAHHDVARYTFDAMRHRESITRANGATRTFFVGAYLGDGLHEGAVRSALDVARALGGRDLGFGSGSA